MKISWFRTHIRLTVAVVSATLLLATSVIVFAGHLSFIHASVPITGGTNSYNWAGYEADATRGTYTNVYIRFEVPTITGGSPGDVVSVWAGLGGVPGVTDPTVLVEAGVTSTLDQNGNQVNTPWWEVDPSVGQQVMPIGTINSGDTITMFVTSNWQGSGADTFSISDYATGDSYVTPPLTDSADFSDSATAECMVGYPQISGDGMAHHFAEFNRSSAAHALNIDNCTVGTDNSQTGIGNVTHSFVQMMTSDGSTTMAAPGVITNDDGTSFTVYWYNPSS